jgi:hypothetical protein
MSYFLRIARDFPCDDVHDFAIKRKVAEQNLHTAKKIYFLFSLRHKQKRGLFCFRVDASSEVTLKSDTQKKWKRKRESRIEDDNTFLIFLL